MEMINDSIAEEFEQIESLVTAMNQMTSVVREVEDNAESASASTLEASTVLKKVDKLLMQSLPELIPYPAISISPRWQ